MQEHQEPIQYLIFIFDDFTNNEKLIELIALQLSSFTDGNSFVKYNHGNYGVVINLQSHISYFEFRDYVHTILENVVSQYFLIEKPKNMYAYMPPELKINLFDLHEDNIEKEQKNANFKDKINILDNFMFHFTSSLNKDSSLSEEEMERMFENIMYKLDYEEEETPTIDEILEKINDEGIESLTNTEKQILDEYSKK